AVPVRAHAELVAPHLLLQRHADRPAGGQLLPVAAQLVAVVAAEADTDPLARVVRHPGRRVRAHQREPAAGLQHRVHDLVGIRRISHSELAERVHVQSAPEYLLIELHRLTGIPVEADVRIEARRHRTLLPRVGPEASKRRPAPPTSGALGACPAVLAELADDPPRTAGDCRYDAR